MPCPKCNPSSEDEPPRLPKGFKPDDGARQNCFGEILSKEVDGHVTCVVALNTGFFAGPFCLVAF
jgi:hypothetical protein